MRVGAPELNAALARPSPKAASSTCRRHSSRAGSTTPGWSSPPPTTTRSTAPSPTAGAGAAHLGQRGRRRRRLQRPDSGARRARSAADRDLQRRRRADAGAPPARDNWKPQLDESLGALAELLGRERERIRARFPQLGAAPPLLRPPAAPARCRACCASAGDLRRANASSARRWATNAMPARAARSRWSAPARAIPAC